MPKLKENAFTFESGAVPEDTFSVVRFSGEEGLSTLYRFDILLISDKEDIDLTAVLQNPATFTVKGHFSDGPDLPFHGILSAFEQMHQAGPYVFYRAELRPKLWWLTLTHHNQVFLDKKMDRFLGEVLEDGGLSRGADFDFRFQNSYQPWEYVCQYGESHFAFVSRWMEREGAYYWFEQGEQVEKMIASDTLIAHSPLPGHETFLYSPPSGLDAADAGAVIKRFTLKQSPLPKKVLLKDYNYMKPSLDLEGRAAVQENGRGEVYLYGEHFPDKGEGERLAGVRAEEYLCREKVFHGLSSIPAVRPGYLFTLDRHYSKAFNRSYLTTSVHHEGSQERYLISGLGVTELEDREGLFYRNNFECIPGSTQYRPPRGTPKPRISGTISARVDAAGSGKYAELDDHGRYKVILPFDLSGRKDGKGSTWLRMATPYAGADHGMHFPLHKGTEVLLTFIDGDPDRPIIQAAVPNPEAPSVVTSAGQTSSRIESGSGHKVVLEDQEGKESVGLFCSNGDGDGSWLWMGKRSPESMHVKSKGNKHELVCGQEDSIVLGSENYVTVGSHMDVKIGTASEFVVAQKFAAELAGSLEIKRGAHLEFGKTTEIIKDSSDLLGLEEVAIRAGLSPDEIQTLQSVHNKIALGVAAVAALVAAAGGDMTSAKFPEKEEGKEAWKHFGLSMAPIFFAAVVQIGAMKYLLKKLKTEFLNPRTKMTMNREGITIRSTQEANQGIKIEVADEIENVEQNPATQIALQEGSIVIKKNEGGEITVNQSGVVIEKGARRINIAEDRVEMVATEDNNFFRAMDSEVTMKKGPNRILIQDAEVLIVKGENGIKIDDRGIKLKFGEGEFETGLISQTGENNMLRLG